MPHWVPPSVTKARWSGMAPAKALDRRHRASADLSEGHEAGVDGLAVQQYGARAAFALTAPFLGARQAALLAQHVEQALHRVGPDVDLLAVQPNCTVGSDLDAVPCQFQLAVVSGQSVTRD